ncbi:MAG: Flp pilus assembly complex ATPase component TadA [Planctomycetes bacterium]|nr:Flp pilus assembly complex ATPase component TadA [Planctomycetota bacterium]
MHDSRLGTILLEGGVIDEGGLERCLAIQALGGNTRPIGQILVEQGMLDQATLERILELQRVRCADEAAAVSVADLESGSLLAAAVANRASELVISEGRPARIRVANGWRRLTDHELGGPEVWEFVRAAMGADVLEQLAEKHFVVRTFRVDGVAGGTATAFRQFEGVAVRVTFAVDEAATPSELGVPDAVAKALEHQKGLVLCVGERGIGRAELLAGLLGLAARESSNYVIVVDDQEVPLPVDGGLVVQRRYGADEAARADALRSVVREDPDVMVIADVGSPSTFDLALRAAEGGRLVIAYLDAHNVTAALTRVLNFYPVYEVARVRSSLAAVLRCVLVRQLLPDADHTGVVPATELLLVDDAACEVVRRGALDDLRLLLRSGTGTSGHSLDQSLLDLLVRGRVRLEDVFARCEEKAWLLERTRTGVKETC